MKEPTLNWNSVKDLKDRVDELRRDFFTEVSKQKQLRGLRSNTVKKNIKDINYLYERMRKIEQEITPTNTISITPDKKSLFISGTGKKRKNKKKRTKRKNKKKKRKYNKKRTKKKSHK